MVKPRKLSSQSSVGSEDSAAAGSVDRQDSDQLKYSQQFRQKQSSIQSQINPPVRFLMKIYTIL